VKSSHQHDLRRSHFVLMYLLMGLELVCTAPRLSAEEQQRARHHSLIHPQESDSRSREPGTVTPTAPLAGQPDARSLHRKLTKRPRQATITAPSAGSGQGTAPFSQVTPTVPTHSDSRLSTGVTAIATQVPVTNAPVSSTSTVTSVPLAGATLSTSKPAAASGFASAGIAAAVSSGSGVTGGRGMQRLIEQMAGLSQLLAPTLSAPAPPSSSSPPPSPPPPGTGSALLSWTPDSGSNLAGYKIYVGTAPGQYGYPGSPIVIGLASSYTLSNLPQGQTYYFAISAYTYSGTESGLSNEVSKSIY
jgi:hypothetical protein